MSIVASAPGKLVLTGEYAVLEGAPALVLAVDRRACVTLDTIAGDTFVIDAGDLGVHDAVAYLDANRRLHLEDATLARSNALAVVGSVIESVVAAGTLPGFRVALDTHAFFSSGPGHHKFGFGSSAAIAVALGGALHAHAGLGPPSVSALVAAHRRAQDGRGSGLDIAASYTGGVIGYQLRDGQPQITPARWPHKLQFCCAWTMRAASTGVFLRRLAEWGDAAPASYAALMQELTAGAAAAAAAFLDGNVGMLLEAIDAYTACLARLGEASGLDIMSAEHRRLAAIASACGISYKPCGAGGGDIGIALGTDVDRMHAFQHDVAQAGLRILDVQLAPRGLHVE